MTSKISIGSLTIHYLSHAGFVIEKDNNKIVIDPFLEGNDHFKNPLAKLTCKDIKATDILLTHGHFDHAIDALKLADLTGATITATPDIAAWLKKQNYKSNGITIGGTTNLSWGSAHYRYAMHANSLPNSESTTDAAASILLNFGDIKLYHLGDTGLQLDFKLVAEVYMPDIVIIPIGGHFTTNLEEAVIAAKWLKAKHIIPMHYNTFPQITADVALFKRLVEQEVEGSTCHILEVAEKI
ncbi:metal-dependent hydrolase [Rickettsiales bacterium LUAb2]